MNALELRYTTFAVTLMPSESTGSIYQKRFTKIDLLLPHLLNYEIQILEPVKESHPFSLEAALHSTSLKHYCIQLTVVRVKLKALHRQGRSRRRVFRSNGNLFRLVYKLILLHTHIYRPLKVPSCC